MGSVPRALVTGGISNKEAITGVVMPQDFVKAPESVMQTFVKPVTYPTEPALAPPPPSLQPQYEGAAKASASASSSNSLTNPAKRTAYGLTSLIGD